MKNTETKHFNKNLTLPSSPTLADQISICALSEKSIYIQTSAHPVVMGRFIITGKMIIEKDQYVELVFNGSRWIVMAIMGSLYVSLADIEIIPHEFTFKKWIMCLFTRKWE